MCDMRTSTSVQLGLLLWQGLRNASATMAAELATLKEEALGVASYKVVRSGSSCKVMLSCIGGDIRATLCCWMWSMMARQLLRRL